jgi:hypothetical protein
MKNALFAGIMQSLTFPILPNEEFTFNYNEKHGVELEFGIKKDKNKK